MSEIADFLRARIAERRALARACLAEAGEMRAGDPYPDGSGFAESDDFPSYPWGLGEAELAHLQQQHPQEIIADLDAKLAVINLMDETLKYAEGDTEVDHYGALDAAEQTLRLLAKPFAGHPDHKGEEWAP